MTALPAAEASFALSTAVDYASALDRLREASHAYYGGGNSPMDDASFDALRRAVLEWEAAHPGETAGSPTGLVADGAAPEGDVPHTSRLLSLDNVFSPEELAGWEASLERRLGRAAEGGFTVEPKLDGAAVAVRYRGGRLVRIVTRGDGSHGEDVSHVIGSIVGLPEWLAEPVTFEARGEVLFTQAFFPLFKSVSRDVWFSLDSLWSYETGALTGVPLRPLGRGESGPCLCAVRAAGEAPGQ